MLDVEYRVSLETASPAFADLDKDGDFDLIIGSSNVPVQRCYCYENIGTISSPSFEYKSEWINAHQDLNNPKPAVVDLDNDGDKDLLIGDFNLAGSKCQGFRNDDPTPSVPELSTLILMCTGLLVLLGYVGYARKKSRKR